ncbi:MAG: hypothetical protein ABIJ96_07630 [Elusimicrobiota bacterium]
MRTMLYASFFLSGFSALTYELLWLRRISLYCGQTTLAVAAVLAAVMSGLAVGGLLGAGISRRHGAASLPRAYALLQAGIAASALLSWPALAAASTGLLDLGLLSAPPWLQSAAWFVSSIALLLVPTAFMGATLPVLTQWLGGLRTDRRPLGLLYGINVLGAAAGALATGFYLVPERGLRQSLLAAAAGSLAAAALAYGAGGREAAADAEQIAGPSGRRTGLALLGAAGAGAMICQIAWTRAFVLVLGSSTYAVTVTLASFLLAFALGSVVFHRLRARLEPTLFSWGLLCSGIAVSLVFFMLCFDKLPYLMLRLQPWTLRGPWQLHLVQLLLCAPLMFFPAFLMGASLPWAAAALSPDGERSGSVSGACFAVNTIGSAAGCAAAGLALIPGLGIERALQCAVCLFTLIALAAVMPRTKSARGRTLAAALLLAAAAPLLLPWDAHRLSSGTFLYAGSAASFSAFASRLRENRLLFYRDGITSSIAVLESPGGDRTLRINGKADASTADDMTAQRLFGHLPVLAHSGTPRRGLVIGMGSGVTAGALASHRGMERVDTVEIEPAVLTASILFRDVNRAVYANPKFRPLLADARTYIAAPGIRYDIITSEPSNPWIAGIAGLYTREAFALARGRLAADGIYCQWLPGYGLLAEDFRMILNTFAAVFPHKMLLAADNMDYMLLGSKEPLAIDYRRFAAVFSANPAIAEDLASTGLDHPFVLLAAAYRLDDSGFRAAAAGGAPHTDDRPTLEFSAPRSLHGGQHMEIFAALDRFRKPSALEQRRFMGMEERELRDLRVRTGTVLLRRRDLQHAELFYRAALGIPPAGRLPLPALGALLTRRGYPDAGRLVTEAARSLFP